MTNPDGNKTQAIDIVIPVYGERPGALEATLSACTKQTYAVSKIFVVDDGSPEPVRLPDWALSLSQISLIRLPQNQGISAARNAALARSDTAFVACINTEVLPDPDWLATCHKCLSNNTQVGACYTRIVSVHPKRLLTQWRMRFQESKYGDRSGPTLFAHGHAVLFRKEAIEAVGGYDPRLRLHHEDSDICFRMRAAGWETLYIAEGRCISIQADSLRQLAGKELRDRGWYPLVPKSPLSLFPLLFQLSRFTFVRAGRNVVRGYFQLLPVDAAIWATALWMAAARTLRGTK